MKSHATYANATNWFDMTVDSPFDVVPKKSSAPAENWISEVPEEDLKRAIERYMRAGQLERSAALADLVEISRLGADRLAGIRSTLALILNSSTHGRVGEAVDFLAHVGASSVRNLASTAEPSGFLGYVIVRALGRIGERDLVLRFKDRDETTREGVVEALDEIGDSVCLNMLAQFRDCDPSPLINRLAGELLADR